MHGFCIFSGLGVGGGRKRPQNTVFWGPKRIHGVLRILSVFCPYSTESQNTQNTDRIRTMYSGGQNTSYSLRILCILFWWTEYRILSKQQNTDRIRTEYGQNTVITKSPIVITNSTPSSPHLGKRLHTRIDVCLGLDRLRHPSTPDGMAWYVCCQST